MKMLTQNINMDFLFYYHILFSREQNFDLMENLDFTNNGISICYYTPMIADLNASRFFSFPVYIPKARNLQEFDNISAHDGIK